MYLNLVEEKPSIIQTSQLDLSTTVVYCIHWKRKNPKFWQNNQFRMEHIKFNYKYDLLRKIKFKLVSLDQLLFAPPWKITRREEETALDDNNIPHILDKQPVKICIELKGTINQFPSKCCLLLHICMHANTEPHIYTDKEFQEWPFDWTRIRVSFLDMRSANETRKAGQVHKLI